MAEGHGQAEEATAHALGSLPAGAWAVIQDVWPERALANVDHLVVGPQGVFVIESKDWAGRVTVEGGILRQDGASLSSVVSAAAAAAEAVARWVADEHRDHVRAVICLKGNEGPIALVDGVLVCSTTTLVTLLTTRPTVLSDPDVPAVAGSVRAHLRERKGGARTGLLGALLGVVRRRKHP